jgi:hypothetical protein
VGSIASLFRGKDLSAHKDRSSSGSTAMARAHVSESIPPVPELLPIVLERLTRPEQRVWEELVDDARLDPPGRSHSEFPIASLAARRCCTMPLPSEVDFRCSKCGSTQAHYLATVLGAVSLVSEESVNQRDSFNNTPLHCASASEFDQIKLWTINGLIQRGANPLAMNTFGQTFLHALQPMDPMNSVGLDDFKRLLRALSDVQFPFLHKDYHGRTVPHVILQPTKGFFPLEVVEEIFSICKPDVYSRDILGNTISDYLYQAAQSSQNSEYSLGIQKLLGQCRRQHPAVNYRLAVLELSDLSKTRLWLERIISTHLINWIDVNGDTPLIAILKYWAREYDEFELNDVVTSLIVKGAEIHMKDRNGDTALAIATVRGLRPSATTLLVAGANIHSHDFFGAGIIAQASRAMLQAKEEEDGKLYAMILSCLTLLIDAGAKKNPTERDEWISPDALLA